MIQQHEPLFPPFPAGEAVKAQISLKRDEMAMAEGPQAHVSLHSAAQALLTDEYVGMSKKRRDALRLRSTPPTPPGLFFWSAGGVFKID